jgi:glycine/D-amino acid oxidase-like deaminating enzyme
MKKDILIVGQGICGTFLAWELEKASISFLILDEARPLSASRIAAGLINPVTGRRLVKTWMADELIPFARDAYTRLSEVLGIPNIREMEMNYFFPNPQMRQAFLDRLEEKAEFLQACQDDGSWDSLLKHDFGYGKISPCYLVDLPELLSRARKRWIEMGLLQEIRFESSRLQLGEKGVSFEDVQAGRIIFCDGMSGFHSPYFKNLPFAPNKGEALILEIPGLPKEKLYKTGFLLLPWRDGLFWAGSSYQWSFENDEPSAAFRDAMLGALRVCLRVPFALAGHVAGIRPATLERRPFLGFHPSAPQIGIFNGMGTKGCSLAPYFARQWADHLGIGKNLPAEVDIKRFSGVLNRS